MTVNKKLNLSELSMGMSADYIEAAKNSATYIRIGLIFLEKKLGNFYFSIFLKFLA